MELPVGPPVAGCRPQRQPRHRAAATIVPQFDRLGQAGTRRGGVTQPQRLQHGDTVRRNLYAGADLGERRRRLEHQHPGAAPGQGDRRCKAADAGADDRDLLAGEAHAAGRPRLAERAAGRGSRHG